MQHSAIFHHHHQQLSQLLGWKSQGIGGRRRHRHLLMMSLVPLVLLLLPHNELSAAKWEWKLEIQEAVLLETDDTVADDEVTPAAMSPIKCAGGWALDHLEAFGCGRGKNLAGLRPESGVGSIHDLSFLVQLAVYKEDRLRRLRGAFTNCTGLALDDDLILTHAHCVGPRTETEITTRIWAFQPLVPGGLAPIEATRVCWSFRLWWPNEPRAPYSIAVVKLATGLSAALPARGGARPSKARKPPAPVCLARDGQYGSERNGSETCALVSMCKRTPAAGAAQVLELVERPYTNESHWFRIQEVHALRAYRDCRREVAGPLNPPHVKLGPRMISCFESLRKRDLRQACRDGGGGGGGGVEMARAVFCWPKGCPGPPDTPVQGPNLVGLAPMDYDAGQPAAYRPLEANLELNKYITSVGDLGKIHHRLKDMLVDARVHTHGGSLRTICRQLARGPLPDKNKNKGELELEPSDTQAVGFVRGVPVTNAGYRFSSEDVPNQLSRYILPSDLPSGGIDAFDSEKCWQMPQRMWDDKWGRHALFPERFIWNVYNWTMPYLVDLKVRKRIPDWNLDPNQPAGYEHTHSCDAWLVSHDTVLTHAECVAPENMFDRPEAITMSFPRPPVPKAAAAADGLNEPAASSWPAGFEWPEPRHATKVCWPREALPPRWHRGLELAVVRFKPSVKYARNILEPICLDPERQIDYENHCNFLVPCAPPNYLQTWGDTTTTTNNTTDSGGDTTESINHANSTRPDAGQTVLLSAQRCTQSWAHQQRSDGKSIYPEWWFEQRYNSTHLRAVAGLRATDRPCPNGRPDRWRAIVCRGFCRANNRGCAYLAGLGLAQIFPEHANVRYTGRVMFEARPRLLNRRFASVTIDLIKAKPQLMELLLASRADNEGTRDVSCQMLPGEPARRRRRRRSRSEKGATQGSAYASYFDKPTRLRPYAPLDLEREPESERAIAVRLPTHKNARTHHKKNHQPSPAPRAEGGWPVLPTRFPWPNYPRLDALIQCPSVYDLSSANWDDQ